MLLALALAPLLAPLQDDPGALPRAVHQRFLELAPRLRWPDLEPAEMPVALVGEAGVALFAHPAAEGAVPAPEDLPGADGVALVAGEHTAVVHLGDSASEVDGAAAALVGEVFRAHLARARPDWATSRRADYLYPAEDAEVLFTKRVETVALRRALLSQLGEEAAGWARRALEERRHRYARLPEEARELERRLERSEGLVHYARALAAERSVALDLPEEAFAPGALRRRSAATGAALAALLDRFSGPWRARLVEGEHDSLDALLRDALTSPGFAPPDLEPGERRALEDAAVLDAVRHRIERHREREEFTSRPGWSVEVHAEPRAPLFVTKLARGAPRRIDGSELLHGEGLRVRNLLGDLSLPGRRALTYAAGEDPLHQGVARVLVAGLEEEPEVSVEGLRVRVSAPGFELEFEPASVRREVQRWHVDLGRP